MSQWSTKAATAASNPTKKLSKSMNCLSATYGFLHSLSRSKKPVLVSVVVSCILSIYCHFLTMVTSPLPLILMMEEGVWGFFSCRRDVHT